MGSLRNFLSPDRFRDLPQGTLGLYLFAFSMYSSRLLAVIGCLLMLMDMLRERDQVMPALKRFMLYRWLLALTVYVVLRGLVAMVEAPGAAEEHGKDAARLIYLLGVLLLAWQIHGQERLLLRALLLSAVGFFLARFWYLAWSLRALDGWWDQRHGFGLEAIPLGFYATTMLFGLLAFLPRLRAHWPGPSRQALLMFLWGGMLCMSLLCVVLSQSRAAWLALLPGLMLLLGVALLRIAHSPLSRAFRSLLAALLVAAVLGIFWLSSLTLQERFAEEQVNIDSLLNLDLAALKSGDGGGRNYSIGTRMNMLKSGWDTWLQRPVFGAGPAGAKFALAANPDPVLRRWNDYHNAVINILVCYGVVGLVLVLGGALETARLGWIAARERAYSRDTLLFLGLAFGVLLFSLLTNYRLLNFDWRYSLFLIAGALASPALANLTGKSASSPTIEGPQ